MLLRCVGDFPKEFKEVLARVPFSAPFLGDLQQPSCGVVADNATETRARDNCSDMENV